MVVQELIKEDKMIPVHLKTHSLEDAWFQSLYNIFDYGKEYIIDKGSFEGHKRLEYDFITIHISNPNIRPLVPIIPPDLGIEPPTDMQYVEDYFVNYLMSNEKNENTQYTYGQRILISLEKIINMLKTTPKTNQAIIEIAKPEDIYLSDPPCLRTLHFKIFNNKLIMYIYMRSNDLWSGFPANLAGFQLLKEYIVSEVGCEDGDIIYIGSGLHLYDYCWEWAKKRTYK